MAWNSFEKKTTTTTTSSKIESVDISLMAWKLHIFCHVLIEKQFSDLEKGVNN